MRLYKIEYKNYTKTGVQYLIDNKHITLFNMLLPREKFDFKTFLVRLYFIFISGSNVEIYFVLNNNLEIIHTSYVVGKCYKFPFMKKTDIEIGPCHTKENYRGKGIYKNVLNFINNKYCEKKRNAYMIVDENNIPSIKGIEGVGFKVDGTVKKSKLFKIYRRV